MPQKARHTAEAEQEGLVEIILDEKGKLDDPEEKHPSCLRKEGTVHVEPRFLRDTSEVILNEVKKQKR